LITQNHHIQDSEYYHAVYIDLNDKMCHHIRELVIENNSSKVEKTIEKFYGDNNFEKWKERN